MVFSSMIFLSVFLPVTFLIYSLTPTLKFKNYFLILVSLIFYAYGEPLYVFLMIASSFMNYLFARKISKNRANAKKWLAASVVYNVLILGVFKYIPFILMTINTLTTAGLPIPDIRLPIGISFFTFQAMSYVIDVYREPQMEQEKFSSVLLYISFFPQLIAGPIIKFYEIEKEIQKREFNWDKASFGIRRFIVGLAKKVLIANTMAYVADQIFALSNEQINAPVAWVGAVAYALQIYFDFGGYSDMALGMAQIFGFKFNENFNYPYAADSMQEFWRRWHISLSTWFKEYLYIPLGGNRKGKARTIINKYIVFFTTGLWHGANWTFVIWGLLHGTALVMEDTRLSIKKIPFKVVRQILTMIIVITTFVIFRAENMIQGAILVKKMYSAFWANTETTNILVTLFTPLTILTMVLAIVFSQPVKAKVEKYIATHEKNTKWVTPASFIVAIGLLLMVMMNLASNSYNPFIYFRF